MNNLETKVVDLDVGKSKTVLVYLKKLCHVVDKQVVKNTKFNTLKMKVNKLDKNIPDASSLIHIIQHNIYKQSLGKKNWKCW